MSVSTVDAPIAPNSSVAAAFTLDRRNAGCRSQDGNDVSKAPAITGRINQRRRYIDPTTCERDYSACEVEFMKAMDEYKQSSGRMFPTCSEVLEVLHGLGYVRLNDDQFAQLGLDEDSTIVETDRCEAADTDWQK